MDKRLRYQNLKKDPNLNTISYEVNSNILWWPWINFENLESGDKWKGTDIEKIWKIVPTKNYSYTLGDDSHLNTVYLFSGEENVNQITREFMAEWMCIFEMQWYPFDSQTCIMEFFMAGERAILMPKEVRVGLI